MGQKYKLNNTIKKQSDKLRIWDILVDNWLGLFQNSYHEDEDYFRFKKAKVT